MYSDKPVYISTKTYGHNIGMSCAFRQWRAKSHCHFIHGYAIATKFIFESTELDYRNWVVDFGELKTLKVILEDYFDHKTIVATDDPQLEYFREGHRLGVLDLIEVDAVGCERFAELVYNVAAKWLVDTGYSPRVRLRSVEIMEHGANSAVYEGPNLNMI